MNELRRLTEKVLNGELIDKEEALFLYGQPLEDLCEAAEAIRDRFCGNSLDICAVISGKGGKCSENCKFCPQSAISKACVDVFPLISSDEIVADAKIHKEQGVLRYSVVTAGKSLSDAEVDKMCEAVRRVVSEVGISVCVSFGLLNEDQYRKLKDAGVTRVHNNLETSGSYFPNVCTSHTFGDKVKAIKAAQAAGLDVCSGGIMGVGETPEDRISLAMSLRELGIKSVPVNMLNPVPGTEFGKREKLSNDEMRRIFAVYRFILPTASLRLSGGRGLMEDKGRGCLMSGANAVITGDMVTTAGISVQTDMALISELGFVPKLC